MNDVMLFRFVSFVCLVLFDCLHIIHVIPHRQHITSHNITSHNITWCIFNWVNNELYPNDIQQIIVELHRNRNINHTKQHSFRYTDRSMFAIVSLMKWNEWNVLESKKMLFVKNEQTNKQITKNSFNHSNVKCKI